MAESPQLSEESIDVALYYSQVKMGHIDRDSGYRLESEIVAL